MVTGGVIERDTNIIWGLSQFRGF